VARVQPPVQVHLFVPGEECGLLVKSEAESDTVAHFRGIVHGEFGTVVILIMVECTLMLELASDYC